MKLNIQLLEANDNYIHYRNWAESELTQAHGVIRRQQLEIDLLNQSAGKDPFFAGVYGCVSTESQTKLNGFVDKGIHYKPVFRNEYKPPTQSDMMGSRMIWRAYKLCDIPPERRLEIITKEFPYIRFDSAVIEA